MWMNSLENRKTQINIKRMPLNLINQTEIGNIAKANLILKTSKELGRIRS